MVCQIVKLIIKLISFFAVMPSFTLVVHAVQFDQVDTSRSPVETSRRRVEASARKHHTPSPQTHRVQRGSVFTCHNEGDAQEQGDASHTHVPAALALPARFEDPPPAAAAALRCRRVARRRQKNRRASCPVSSHLPSQQPSSSSQHAIPCSNAAAVTGDTTLQRLRQPL